MDHAARIMRIRADIKALMTLDAQDALDVIDEMLRKFAWPHDMGVAANLQDCVTWLEDTKRNEERADEQYRKPEPQIETLRVLEPQDRVPTFFSAAL